MRKLNIERTICFVITTFLLVGVFSGCGSKTTNTNNVTTVRVWTGFGHTKEMLTKMCNDYNNTIGKEKDIRIEYTAYGGDYKNIYDLAISNDQAPELLKIPGDKIGYVKKGELIPITDMPGGQEFLDEYNMKGIEGYNVFDGKTYSVPVNVTTIGLVYNKDIFKASGIVDENGDALPPKTWDEVRDYAKRITRSENNVYGIAIPLKDPSFFSSWQFTDPFRSSYNTIPEIDWDNLTYDYSNQRKAFEWLLGIKADKSFFPGAESLDNDASRAQFAEGRIGMYIGASWDVGVLSSQFNAKCDWAVAPIPVLNVNERYKQSQNVADFLCIGKSALKTDVKKVMEVYKWFHTNEMWINMYEKEKDIPAKYEVIEKCNASNVSPQWKQFAEFVSKGRFNTLPALKVSLEGESASFVLLKVWAGTISIDGYIADVNKRYTEALRKGVADGSIDINKFKRNIDYRLYD